MTAEFLSKRIDAAQLGTHARGYLFAYYALHLSSLLPQLFLVAVFLLTTARRHPTLVNVHVSFVISSVCASLLLFAGKERGPEPSLSLCITQTSLLNGVPPMWATSVLMLVIYMWRQFAREARKESVLARALMLAAPYVVFAGWAIGALFVSIKHSDAVNRSRRMFYCSVHFDPFANTMALYTFAVCVLIIALQVHLAFLLHRNWRVLRAAGKSGGVDAILVLRTLVFGVYIAAGMAISLMQVWNPTTVLSDFYGATIGIVAVLFFGSQGDVFRVLRFWRRSPPVPVRKTDIKRVSLLSPQGPPEWSANFEDAYSLPFKDAPSSLDTPARPLAAHMRPVQLIGRPSGAFDVKVIGRPSAAFA